jgi:hypothetical protein
MAIHNVTDSALLVLKSRKTIQRYIANGKLTVTRDDLGNPQIDTTELLRVFGKLSQVSQKKIIKKSQNVAPELSQQNSNDDRVDKLIGLVEQQQLQISELTESVKALTNRLEFQPVVDTSIIQQNNVTSEPDKAIKSGTVKNDYLYGMAFVTKK